MKVELVAGKGTKDTGGAPGGFYWHIYTGGVKAGKVFINIINEPPLGEHPSIQIYLNQKSQGKGIGRVAYHMACELSGYPKIYAHMRKSNLASLKAAEYAGFKIISDKPQLTLEWQAN